jgi:hypothetical protein
MDYSHFFNRGTNTNNIINNIESQKTMNSINTVNTMSRLDIINSIKNTIVSQKYLDTICNITVTTSPRLWATMLGLSIPAICYAGYKIFKWIDSISKTDEELYEYKYLDDLDKLLEIKLDDMKNPEIADVDTIKVGKKIFPLEIYRTFKKNYRKKLLRETDKQPIIKCVPIPANKFNWNNSFTEDILPNENTITMRYEPETESFWWYCDSSTVPYKYLETVARKFVCEFNRLDIFIDIRDELKKGAEELKNRIEKEEKEEKEEKGENEKKIYAKFRRYNKKMARADTSNNGKQTIIKAKANRYSYKGKMEDYHNLFSKDDLNNDEEHDQDTVKIENISYNDWKNEMCEEWK